MVSDDDVIQAIASLTMANQIVLIFILNTYNMPALLSLRKCLYFLYSLFQTWLSATVHPILFLFSKMGKIRHVVKIIIQSHLLQPYTW